MTNNELLDLLSFESNLQTVEITSQTTLANNATFIVATLRYPDGTMSVPFVHYTGQDWLFTPCDWQGWLPTTPDQIADIDWRVDDTDTTAVMLNDMPMLAPWVAEEPNPKRATRKRIGQQLKDAREQKGISIRQLAEACDINKSQICRVEAGRLNAGIDTISTIADALGLTITLQ